MRSQSYRTYLPIAPSVTGQSPATARSIPSLVYWLVALAVGSSFYVVIEPAPTDVIFLLIFGVVLVVRSIRLPLDIHPVLSIGILGFFASSVLSLLASVEIDKALFHFSITTYILITWYLLVTLLANYGAPMWELIGRAFLIAAVISAAIGLISHFSTVLQDYLAMQSSYGDRARGAFKDPNVYSPFLCAALLLVVNSTITRQLRTVVSISLICLFSIEILSAFSRGGYLNVTVSMAMLFALHLIVMFRRDWLTRWLILFFLSLLFVVPISLIYLDASGLEEFLFYRARLQDYDTVRFANQALALSTIGEAPFGIGPGQSSYRILQGTHNLYLQIALETGVLSMICFLLFLATTFWICLRGIWRRGPFQDAYACCFAILVGILANSLVIDSLHWRHLFLFLAIPVGLWQYELGTKRAQAASPGAASWNGR